MKKILIILAFGIFAMSCTDMLDQINPTGPTGDDFFKNETELNYAVTSVYAGLSSRSLYGLNMIGLEQLSDNVYTGSTLTDGETARWGNFSFDPSDVGIRTMYRQLYIVINRANIVIAKASEVPGVSTDDLNNYLGQAHFIRGYAYFLLTLMYGDAPIILEPVADPAGTYIAKSTAADIYDVVVSDMKFAEANCKAVQTEKGRITSWVAKAMLAKVHLFGADELGKNDWYGLAENYAQQVISSGVFKLYNDEAKTPTENLMAIFDLANETKTGTEEIFYIQHYNNGGAWSDGDVGTNLPMAYNPRQDRNMALWGFGWGYVFESNSSIWEENDARKEFSLWFNGEPVIVNGVQKGIYDQTKQKRANPKANGMGLQKFWYQENFKTVNAVSNLNWPVLRYADLLLIHAEADLMADNQLSGAGLASINQVRNRAGLASLSAAEVNRERILKERHVELFGEFHRWFDLVRTKTATQAFARISSLDTDGDDTEKEGFNPARNYKFPMPQTAMERNPELVQHPEWSGE